MPWYNDLEHEGIICLKFKKDIQDMTRTRNGFDHAWTKYTEAQPDIEAKGNEYLAVLQDIINQLSDRQLLS
ncbi:MAG: hypothetical protein JZU65_01100 [Chlorobium sp.]|nr:hypothetical protein [Chlorobium sp.]